jgi:hypothetical protein
VRLPIIIVSPPAKKPMAKPRAKQHAPIRIIFVILSLHQDGFGGGLTVSEFGQVRKCGLRPPHPALARPFQWVHGMGSKAPILAGLSTLVVLEHRRSPRPERFAASVKLQATMKRKQPAGAERIRANCPKSGVFSQFHVVLSAHDRNPAPLVERGGDCHARNTRV